MHFLATHLAMSFESYLVPFLSYSLMYSLAKESKPVFCGVAGWCEGVVYLTSPGRPTDIGLQLGKACYPCSR